MCHPWSDSVEQHQQPRKAQCYGCFQKGLWWPRNPTVPKARWPQSPSSDTWMIGAGSLYQGLHVAGKLSKQAAGSTFFTQPFTCSHKAHCHLCAINHGVSEAGRGGETGSTATSGPDGLRAVPGEAPRAGKVISKKHLGSQEQHALHLPVIKLEVNQTEQSCKADPYQFNALRVRIRGEQSREDAWSPFCPHCLPWCIKRPIWGSQVLSSSWWPGLGSTVAHVPLLPGLARNSAGTTQPSGWNPQNLQILWLQTSICSSFLRKMLPSNLPVSTSEGNLRKELIKRSAEKTSEK